ncbi:MAG: hypothetical protein U0Q16_03860 [Bryobacteraceae bacterium]
MTDFLILGCGYTGRRVARLLEGRNVAATSRHPESLAGLPVKAIALDVLEPGMSSRVAERLPRGIVALHSIPVLEGGIRATPLLRPILEKARRVIYLSTTGVYGATPIVDEATPPRPRTQREQLRFDEEHDIANGPWQSLILRPAAIYGPDRGVHVSMREGRHRYWGDGSNHISRIHADDLATITARALESEITGAYPVADNEPATAIEITRFCADLLGLPVPAPSAGERGDDTRGSNRRVDGRFIRQQLGVELRYPTYREGIIAAGQSS